MRIFLGCLIILGCAWRSSADDLSRWRYYSEIELQSQPWDTTREVCVDFTYLLEKVGSKGTFDEDSIRVYSLDRKNGLPENLLPARFVADADYDGKNNACGRVLWLVKGERDDNRSVTRYRIYFDTREHGPKERIRHGQEIGEANLTPNAGFEDDADGNGLPDRTPCILQGMKLDASVVHDGKWSVMMPAFLPSAYGFFITPYPGYREAGRSCCLRVTANAYSFGFWSKGKDCAGSKYKYDNGETVLLSYVTWYNNRIEEVPPRMTVMEKKGIPPFSWDWQFSRNIFSPPRDAVYGVFSVSYPCGKGNIWIDDPLITLIQPPELVDCHVNK